MKALVSRPISTCRSSTGSPSAARSGSTLGRRARRPRGGSSAATASVDRELDADDLGLALADRLHPGQRQQRLGQPADAVDVLGEAVEEVVARLGVVLGAGAQDLDRARHPGDRVAQLVRGVGDELALGLVAPQLLGAVADDEQGRALGRQVAGADRVDALADPRRGRSRRCRDGRPAGSTAAARRRPCRPRRSARAAPGWRSGRRRRGRRRSPPRRAT